MAITPTAALGTTVSGFVGMESWDPQTTESQEIVDLPYAYTVGCGPAECPGGSRSSR